jgi:hypothetical protein
LLTLNPSTSQSTGDEGSLRLGVASEIPESGEFIRSRVYSSVASLNHQLHLVHQEFEEVACRCEVR